MSQAAVPLTVQIEQLAELLRAGPVTVLSGAGISTDSGIPDYRGPKTKHLVRNPVKHDEFVRDPFARQRYWSRAARGYTAVGSAQPNISHFALAKLESAGFLRGTITQNVDGLHQKAGSQRVLELHGSLQRVRCLGCDRRFSRAAIQAQIEQDNPGWITQPQELAPDGDAEVRAQEQTQFNVPQCISCRGDLMPDVIFFGGSVPKTWVAEAHQLVDEAAALLVVGSSLTVFSGYRFARQAARAGKPIAILSLGPTRADQLATLKLDAPLAEVLPTLAEKLNSASSASY